MQIEDIELRIAKAFNESARVKHETIGVILPEISRAALLLSQCFSGGSKILVCGNGGSAADAQHFAAEFVGHFERKRRGLAAIALSTDTSALTAIGNDDGYDQVFSRHVEALGKAGDVLVVITTSGNSQNILRAVEEAHRQNLLVIALTGKDGGKVKALLKPLDVELRAQSQSTPRIQETHITMLHCLADAVDEILFSEEK